MKEKTLSVSAIKEGTVIDHIEAGGGLKIIRLLRLIEGQNRVTVGLNLKSSSMGLKDLIKIENITLSPLDTDQIAIFAPLATINVIKGYSVTLKFLVNTPTHIKDVLACPNIHCITNIEPSPTLFSTEENGPTILLRCHFCEKLFSRKEIKEKAL